MSMYMKDLLEMTRQRYSLNLIAGGGELEHLVTWVHMLDHAEIAEYFWGNELAITSGYALKNSEVMIDFIDNLFEHRCIGLVINVGKYVKKIPKSVAAHCDKLGFLLLTMPWHKSITEFVRECCSIITDSERDEEYLVEKLARIFKDPAEADVLKDDLNSYFDESAGFTMLSVIVKRPAPLDYVTEHRRRLRFHTAMRQFNFKYLIFIYENTRFVLLNKADTDIAAKAAENIIAAFKNTFKASDIFVGVGKAVNSYGNLGEALNTSLAASRMAKLQKNEIIRFSQMGYYGLLYCVPDKELLTDFYYETMNPLLGEKADAEYPETLFRYLLSGCSLKETAEKMHTHRNTVYYRMGKIREILGSDLSKEQERLPYLIAYSIGKMLGLNEDFE